MAVSTSKPIKNSIFINMSAKMLTGIFRIILFDCRSSVSLFELHILRSIFTLDSMQVISNWSNSKFASSGWYRFSDTSDAMAKTILI